MFDWLNDMPILSGIHDLAAGKQNVDWSGKHINARNIAKQGGEVLRTAGGLTRPMKDYDLFPGYTVSNRAGQTDINPFNAPQTTSGSGGGGGGGGWGDGTGDLSDDLVGDYVDPTVLLQAQQANEAKEIQDRILGRRGEVDTILNEILGRVDNLLRDRKQVRDQQYGFDTEALVDSLKGSIPEIEKAFASLGLSNSTFVGDRRDDTNKQYQLSQGATDRALASDLAEYGQWADTERSKARTNASDMRHTFDSISKMTPNHMNLSNLQSSELDLNKGLSGFGEQKNRFTTSGDALKALNSIGSDYDFDQILNSFATTASAKADTGSGGAASKAVLDNIQGNNKKKRLTETQINNPVGAATA